MIEELKRLPVEEQIKRLTNPDSLKKILDTCSSVEEFENIFLILEENSKSKDIIDPDEFEELFLKNIEIIVKDAIEKKDNDFLNHFIQTYYILFTGSMSVPVEILDYDSIEFLLNISSNNSKDLWSILGQLSKEQVNVHRNKINQVIENSDVSNIYNIPGFLSEDLSYVLKILDLCTKPYTLCSDINNLGTSILEQLPQDKINQYIDKGYEINKYTPPLLKTKSNLQYYYQVFLSKNPSEIDFAGLVNDADEETLTKELYAMYLDSAQDIVVPDFIFNNTDLLSAVIENLTIPKGYQPNGMTKMARRGTTARNFYEFERKLWTVSSKVLTPELFRKLIDSSNRFFYVIAKNDDFLKKEYWSIVIDENIGGVKDFLINNNIEYNNLSTEQILMIKGAFDGSLVSQYRYDTRIKGKHFLEYSDWNSLAYLIQNGSDITQKLSKFQQQCLQIYSLFPDVVSLRVSFKSFVLKNLDASELSLKQMFGACGISMVIELNKYDNGIIKNDLSKEQLECLRIYTSINSHDLQERFALVVGKISDVMELSLQKIFINGDFDLVLELNNIDNNIIKNDLSKEQLECLRIYTSIKSRDLKERFALVVGKISDVMELSLQKIFINGDFDLVSELNNIDNDIIKNDLSKEQLQILKMYFNIESSNLKVKFKNYVIEHPELNIEQISSVAIIFDRISKSNSSEIRKLEIEISDAILQLDNPIYRFEQIEDVFLKNNLPTVGKVYKVFEIMHPNFKGFDFSIDRVSPVLKSKSKYGREIIVFADLIKSFMGSNNRSMNNYLNSLELGNKVFIEVSEGRLNYEQLSNEQIEVLQEFVSHLNTLYNNTKKGKNGDNKELTGNVIEDIRFLKSLFSVDGKLDYNLPDRIIKMYCHFAGIDTLEQAKQYVKTKIKESDDRGRKYALGEFTLEEGDFVKGIGGIEFLGNILQNGSNSKEYLGSSADSDMTPLDTDLCIVLENGTINQCISNTATGGYGPIYFVLKNRDNRFTITRRSPKEKIQSIDTKLDLTRIEAFYTGAIGNGEHYGIRTGFASSEIDYIVVNSYDDRIGLEIAMNGFYIPVVDRQGKLVFSPDEYDKLRSKMNGLSYYGMGEFILDSSISSMTSELEGIVKGISDNRKETQKKSDLIDSCIKLGLGSMGLSLTHKIDLLPNSVVLFNTGSTGRYTNLPGDGDFDFMMQVDQNIYDDPQRFSELRNNIIIALGGNPSDVLVVGNDIREFKTIVTDSDGKKYPVEIDITFIHKTDKTEYASDVCVSDRLNNISSDDDCNLVKANVILAKKLLKGLGAYKPSRKDKTQGGMGGIGVENWILQNGGTLYSAAKSFIECADTCSSFDEFVSKYKLYNFGINHMADKKGFYPHDNYIENMNSTGYEKMKQGLKKYIELCEKGISNPCEEIISQISNSYDLNGVIDKFKYEDSSEIKSDTQQILCASIDSSIEIEDVNLGQTGYMYQYSDGDKTYLVKIGVNKNDMKVRPARACVQECASVLQGIISPSTCVPVKVYGKGSVKVSVQEKIDGAHNITTDEIIKNHTRELLGEYVCDYLLGNFDSDAQNFIVDKEGVLRGIDKEQSFKYLLEEENASLSLDFSYNPSGSKLSIYSQFLSYLEQNGLSEENLSYLNSIVAKIQKISDEDYINMFKSYAYSYDASRSGEIFSKILQRKKYFEANVQSFIQRLSGDISIKSSFK